jgi:hypothetical protein
MHIGLCEGRHEIKTNEGEALDGFIFGTVDNPMDFSSHFNTACEFFERLWHEFSSAPTYTSMSMFDCNLYVTGLTSLLTATLLAAKGVGVDNLTLMHYDRESGKYVPQDVSALL